MKSILFLCITVIVFLLMAGCSQTAQQGQPAATATPTTPAGTVSATPVSATPVVTMTTSVSGNTVIIQNMAFNPAQITVNARLNRAMGQQGQGRAFSCVFPGGKD